MPESNVNNVNTTEMQGDTNSSESPSWSLNKIAWISVITLGLLLIVCVSFFLWGRELHWRDERYIIDNEVWGTFGDFCGGVLGLFLSLFACLLMIWTFREQRILTINNSFAERRMANENATLQSELSLRSQNKAELQRFNDLFFQLLALYRQQDNDLRNITGNKPYFDEHMRILRNNFKEYVKYGDANRYAGEKYLEFYGKRAYEIAPHFRTLYRIFNLIDSSKIDDDNKLEYAKIIRAQLSEGELFFLRYNCKTPYGRNFIEYVNKYRLLKHLPFLSLLEVKKFRTLLLESDSKSGLDLNLIIYDMGKEIYNRVVGKIELSDEKIAFLPSAKFKFYLHMSSYNRLQFEMHKDNKVKKAPKRYKPLDSLNDEQLLNLMYIMMKDMFIYSNFGNYNPNVIIEKRKETIDNVTSFIVSVNNETKLRLSHPAWDERYNITSA